MDITPQITKLELEQAGQPTTIPTMNRKLLCFEWVKQYMIIAVQQILGLVHLKHLDLKCSRYM